VLGGLVSPDRSHRLVYVCARKTDHHPGDPTFGRGVSGPQDSRVVASMSFRTASRRGGAYPMTCHIWHHTASVQAVDGHPLPYQQRDSPSNRVSTMHSTRILVLLDNPDMIVMLVSEYGRSSEIEETHHASNVGKRRPWQFHAAGSTIRSARNQ
jgi:hypothetical protein